MANSKISTLTSATTPLAGTETLPVVQSSTTKQVSVANLTAGRNVSMSGGTVTSGGSIRSYRPDNAIYTDQYMAAGASGGYIFNNANGDGFKWQFGGVDQFTIDVNGNFVQKIAAKGINFTANTPAAGMTSQLLNWYEEGTWTPNQGAGLTLVGAFSSTGKYNRIGRQVSISGTVTGATSVAVAAAGVVTSNLPFTVVTAGHGNATNVAINASATVICTSTNVTAASAIAATATITFSATYFV